MNTVLTIGIWVNQFPSLSESFISQKVLKLLERGYAVKVFCTLKHEELLSELFNSNLNLEIILLHKKGALMYAMQHPLKFISNKQDAYQHYVAATINHHKPDILHIEFSGIACTNLAGLRNIQARLIISCRGTAEKVKLISDDKRAEQLKEVFELALKVHCVSDDMKHTILPYCIEPSKIFINHPAIDVIYFQPQRFKQTNKEIIILSAGRLTFQKGFLIGLLAFKKLTAKYTSAKWIIIGDGPLKEELLFHIQQMQLQQFVIMQGSKSRTELKELYNQADIFFLPSVYEGIANVVLEAMSMELPVVSAKAGGMEEVITDGVNGLLADVYDHDQLAEQLSLLAENPQMRKTLGAAAKKHVAENFHIDRQIKIFEEVYQQLAAEKMNG